MKVTTMEMVAGRINEETLGVVRGAASWSHRIMKSTKGGLRGLQYSSVDDLDAGLQQAKERAEATLMAQARALGADAVVGMRIEMRELGSGIYGVSAVGTAVKTAPLPAATPAFQINAANDDYEFVMPPMAMAQAYQPSVMRH
jgi:uncharacterized protein YbjQ (UPF0145 family)